MNNAVVVEANGSLASHNYPARHHNTTGDRKKKIRLGAACRRVRITTSTAKMTTLSAHDRASCRAHFPSRGNKKLPRATWHAHSTLLGGGGQRQRQLPRATGQVAVRPSLLGKIEKCRARGSKRFRDLPFSGESSIAARDGGGGIYNRRARRGKRVLPFLRYNEPIAFFFVQQISLNLRDQEQQDQEQDLDHYQQQQQQQDQDQDQEQQGQDQQQ